MDTLTIYDEYINTLNELSELQSKYRSLPNDPDVRAVIHQNIRECQVNLTRIIADMIHSNPFLDTKRTGQGVLNE